MDDENKGCWKAYCLHRRRTDKEMDQCSVVKIRKENKIEHGGDIITTIRNNSDSEFFYSIGPDCTQLFRIG